MLGKKGSLSRIETARYFTPYSGLNVSFVHTGPMQCIVHFDVNPVSSPKIIR